MSQPAASLRPLMMTRLCYIVSSVGIQLKAYFTDRPILGDEPRHNFFAPLSVAIPIRGFRAGLEPPAAGCAWQDKHWFELKRGPSPLLLPPLTTSISANLPCPSLKNVFSSRVTPGRGLPD